MWFDFFINILGDVVAEVIVLIIVAIGSFIVARSDTFRTFIRSLWVWVKRHWPLLAMIGIVGIGIVLNSAIYLMTRNWLIVVLCLVNILLVLLYTYLQAQREIPLEDRPLYVYDFRPSWHEWTATNWVATNPAWVPTTGDHGLELLPHRVLTHQELTFTQGEICCVVRLSAGALFDIIVHGNLHERFYMARLDTRSEYYDSILSGQKERWELCLPPPAAPHYTPAEQWVTMRIIVDSQTIQLYRDGTLVAQHAYTPLTVPTTISLFAEVAPVMLQEIRIMST